MVPRSGTPTHPLASSFAALDTNTLVNDSPSVQRRHLSAADEQLNALAYCFERFFWRPSHATGDKLMNEVRKIQQNEFALEGTDASSLVARILRSHGLFNSNPHHPPRDHTSDTISDSHLRSLVSATLYCLAGSNAKLFNTGAAQSLAYLLPAAEDNGLLPELEALVERDLELSGRHRVIQSLWDHAEQAGMSLSTLWILIQLSERLHYPMPDDAPLVRAIQLILVWQQRLPPTHDEQDEFESQLAEMTGPNILPDDFDHLLSMAFDLGFCFADDSLHRLITKLITEWEEHPRHEQYKTKLAMVIDLTGLSPNEIAIDGERALSRAVRTGNYALAALLLSYGADPEQRDAGQDCPADQLLRTRQALISEISEITKAQSAFTESQYKKVTSHLLAQLQRNEKMLSLFDMVRQSDQ